ncbi:MAG: hypothetical protein Kow00117_17260 [Phototrophicales bacterium]
MSIIVGCLLATLPVFATGDVITPENISYLQLFETYQTDSTPIDLAWSPDGLTVAYGTLDGDIEQVTWVQTLIALPALTDGHGGEAVAAVVFSADGRRVFSGGLDGAVRVWNASIGDLEETPGLPLYLPGDPSVLSIARHPLQINRLAYATRAGGVYQFTWDVPGDLPAINLPDVERVLALTYSPDGTQLAAAGDMLYIWEADTGELVGRYEPSARLSDVAYSRDGFMIASVGQDGAVRVHLASAPTQTVRIADLTQAAPVAVTFNHDNDLLIVGDALGVVRAYSIPTATTPQATLVFEFTAHTESLTDLTLSPDGTKLATSGGDLTIKLWSAFTPNETGDLNTPQPMIMGEFCAGAPPSRLQIGMRARVAFTDGTQLRLRRDPGGEQLGSLNGGEQFNITGGPVCLGEVTWWRLRMDDGRIGWVAEGDTETYYVEPVIP